METGFNAQSTVKVKSGRVDALNQDDTLNAIKELLRIIMSSRHVFASRMVMLQVKSSSLFQKPQWGYMKEHQ